LFSKFESLFRNSLSYVFLIIIDLVKWQVGTSSTRFHRILNLKVPPLIHFTILKGLAFIQMSELTGKSATITRALTAHNYWSSFGITKWIFTLRIMWNRQHCIALQPIYTIYSSMSWRWVPTTVNKNGRLEGQIL